MAFCFDEAVYIWGTFVEGELKQAAAKAKTDKQAQQKVQMKSKELLTQPEDSERMMNFEEKPRPVPKGKFRDPSTMFSRRK